MVSIDCIPRAVERDGIPFYGYFMAIVDVFRVRNVAESGFYGNG